MTTIETLFTPWQSLAGGALIGLASTLLMLFLGRIMGATGILAGILAAGPREDKSWRVAILLGMITAPLAVLMATGQMPATSIGSDTGTSMAGI